MIINEEYKGFWFLPDNFEEKVPGILYFEANKEIRLELIGGFKSKIEEVLETKSFEIIFGISHKNEKISLIICNGFGSWNLSSEYPTTIYNCHYFIKGKHLSSINELLFDRIKVDLSSLYEWYPSGRISYQIKFSKDDKIIETNCKISDSDYWEKIVNIDDKLVLKIFGAATFTSSPDQRDFNFSQNTFIELDTINSKESFVYLLDKVGLFKQFLSLASLSNVSFLKITFFDNDDYQVSAKGNKSFHPVSLYFVEKSNNTNPKQHQFLFTHREITEAFPKIIINWFGSNKNLAPIRNHLIESIKPKKIFTSLDFLIIIQSLEGYHRRFIDKRNKKKEPFLKTRINELFELFNDIQKIQQNPIDLNKLVKSRNYYSHFFEKDEDVLDGIELFELTEKLRNLLICCVLHLMGFEMELINRILNKNNKI